MTGAPGRPRLPTQAASRAGPESAPPRRSTPPPSAATAAARPPCRWLAPGPLSSWAAGSPGPGVQPGPGGTGPEAAGGPGRSVLFICSFNLLRSFPSPFRAGAAAASPACPSCPGQGGSGAGVPRGQSLGASGAGWWMQHRQATVNFKEFLQDIFINFFLGCFWKRARGRGAAGRGGAEFGSCSWAFLCAHACLNSSADCPAPRARATPVLWAPRPRALRQARPRTLLVPGPRAGQEEGPELAPPTHRTAGRHGVFY